MSEEKTYLLKELQERIQWALDEKDLNENALRSRLARLIGFIQGWEHCYHFEKKESKTK